MMTKTDHMKDMRNVSFSKKVLQRVAGAAVVLLMICLVFAAPVGATGMPDTSWYDESETEFVISTADELAGLAELVNSRVTFEGKTISLDTDVDLSSYPNWTPIGVEYYTFRGTFLGNGHSISNVTLVMSAYEPAGFFGRIDNGATISDLILSNISVTGGSSSGGKIGGIVGYATSGNILNCSVMGNITGVSNFCSVGGIAGFVYGPGVISDCFVMGNISGTDNVGGIVGAIYPDVVVLNCTVEKCIINSTGDVGGIAGYAAGASTISNSIVNDCVVDGCSNIGGVAGFLSSKGEITTCIVNSSLCNGSTSIGGIVGLIDYNSIVSNCQVEFSIINGTEDIGGISGGIGTFSINDGTRGSISGSLVLSSMITGTNDVGGVVGDSSHGITSFCSVRMCDIQGSENIGGLIGFMRDSTDISSHVNSCTVNGESGIGGIVGSIADENKIDTGLVDNCTIAGGGFVGGIVGFGLESTESEIIWCSVIWSTLSGEDESYIGGIGGLTSEKTVIENCTVFMCEINGFSFVGGIVGSGWSDGYIRNCSVSESFICAVDSDVGGIVGSAPTTVLVNCSVRNNTIVGEHMIGGVAGSVSTGSIIDNSTVINCVFSGWSSSIGGISGSVESSIIINSTVISSEGCFGGIAGTVSDGSSIYNCSVRGNTDCLHGIASGVTENSNILNCVVENSTLMESGIAGVVSENSSISNCTVVGCVIDGDLNVGGIASVLRSNALILNCTVIECYINGSSDVGGIAGFVHSDAMIHNSAVTNGTIRSSSSSLGGIAGDVQNNCSIDDCAVSCCIINGVSNIGGIAGGISLSSTIDSCAVVGCTLDGSSSIGGITGSISYSSKVIDCVATGTVNGTSSYVGGIAGGIWSGSVYNTLSLVQFAEATPFYDSTCRIGYSSEDSLMVNNYAWENMTSSGNSFSTEIGTDTSNGTSVSSSEFWNTSSFFKDTLGWDFEHTWKMNSGNDKYQLPVLQFQETPVSGDVSYLIKGGIAPTPGQPDTNWYDASETEFVISTADELAGLAVLVNGGESFDGKTVSLTNDIDLSIYSNWTPIGNRDTPFWGQFNGNSHRISNLTIIQPDGSNLGLFGLILGSSARVSDVNIFNATVMGSSYVGIVSGEISWNSQISNCSVSGIVDGYGGCGGIAGYAHGSSNISSCSVMANVSGYSGIGGIVGEMYDNGTISSSIVIGNISGSSCIGGIAGSIYGTISNCYTVGCIEGWDSVGGIAGSASEGYITDCISLVKSIDADSEYSEVTRIASLSDTTTQNNYAWIYTTCFGEVIVNDTGKEDTQGISISSSVFWNNQSFFENILGWDFENIWMMNSGNDKYQLPVLQFQKIPIDGDLSYLIEKSVVPTPGQPDTTWYDTISSEFVLYTADELAGLAVLVNDGISFEGKTIYLKEDIDLCCYPNWTPIGTIAGAKSHWFKGKFDGQNHSVTNLSINLPDSDNVGLFGVISDSADISNVYLVNASVTGASYTGGIVGIASDSTITNCFVNGTVSGVSCVGSIVGSGDIITNCRATGVVNGSSHIGGIAGSGYTLTNNTVIQSTITASADHSYVGGITGSGNMIYDCSVIDTEVSGRLEAGGITGWVVNSDIVSNCSIYRCVVTGTSSVGGIAGYIEVVTGSVNDCTVDQCTVSGTGYGIGGITGQLYENSCILNCVVNGSQVQGSSNTGGIAGAVWADSTVSDSVVMQSSINGKYGSIGGIAGENYADSCIDSCMVIECTVFGSSDDLSAGGVSGLSRGTIRECSVFQSSVCGSVNSGGIVGASGAFSSDSGSIVNCYVNADVSGTNLATRIGGITGSLSANMTVSNCYVVGVIQGSSNFIGGIAGYSSENTCIQRCIVLTKSIDSSLPEAQVCRISLSLFLDDNYAWLDMTSNGNLFTTDIGQNKRNGASISTEEFWNNQAFFEETLGWDFEHTWKMNSGNDKYQLPVLQFQTTPVSGDASYLLGEGAEPTPTPTPTPEKPAAPTLTPPASLPADAEETTNTVAETNAATKAEVGYQVKPADVTTMKAPTITRGKLSVQLNEGVKVVKTLADGTEEEVEATVNEDGSLTVPAGSLDDAATVTVNFIGRQFGDVTNDGKPDTLDAARVLQASVGLFDFSGADTFYGDVSGDGYANTLDAARILQYSVSLVDENYVTKA